MAIGFVFSLTLVAAFLPGCSTVRESSQAPAGGAQAAAGLFAGEYKIVLEEYQGVLTIMKRGGGYRGTLRFVNWGTGAAEELKNFSIRNNSIYFLRSITSSDDLVKYGSSRYFRQEFHGEFSEDGRSLNGYYNETGVEIKWYARKK